MSGNRKPPPSPLKRKLPQHPELAHRKKRRVDISGARVIAAQTTGKAFSDGHVDVDKFVRARQFEIKALEDAMKRSKKALTARAFQSVPKDLRRRTASHNAKRVPKRLRSKAAREIIDDNTPTGKARLRKPGSKKRLRLDTVKRLKALHSVPSLKEKKAQPVNTKSKKALPCTEPSTAAAAKSNNQNITARPPRVKKNRLVKPPVPKAKFRKRQIHKAWLPTHLFHAKRAHMTPPKEPLWRMAVPLSPTAKSYRPTHRASTTRGAMAWDMSYMSTISLEGPQSTILEVLKNLGVGRDENSHFWDWEAPRWVDGKRSWDGWMYEPGTAWKVCIAPVKVFWVAPAPQATFLAGQGGSAAMTQSKAVKRKVVVRVHPSAFLQLWESLLPLAKAQRPQVMVEDLRFEIGSIELLGPASAEALVGVIRPSPVEPGTLHGVDDFWNYLGAVTNSACLPANAIINMEMSDPRLHHRSRQDRSPADGKAQQHLLRVLSSWPPDRKQIPPKLFDRAHRLRACRQLPSQKAINRRRALAAPNALPEPVASDPRIPVTLLTCKVSHSSRGSWTLLLPWKCVLPVWYSLMHYPISHGGTVSFGGLDQKRQIDFENGTPWFPADFPGTKAGVAWEEREAVKRKSEWEKRPKGKRVEWISLDLGQGQKGEIGLGWSCDWARLVQLDGGENSDILSHLQCLTPCKAKSELIRKSKDLHPENQPQGLLTVRIEMIARGSPVVCARIYRLPSTDLVARGKWISLIRGRGTGKGHQAASKSLGFDQTADAPPHIRRQHLAASLLDIGSAADLGERDHPGVPEEVDLIGFVTTGNFNLSEGKGICIGSILLSKILEEIQGQGQGQEQQRKDRHLCIVREAGQPIGRLARWSIAG